MKRPSPWLAMPLALLLVAGCVYYPTVRDVADVLVRPHNGRAVRDGAQVRVYAELGNTGTSADVLTAVWTPVAQQAAIVSGAGAPLDQVEVPGAAVVSLRPGGPHVLLSGITRDLRPGESVIVTLTFARTGNVGVVTVVE